MGVMDRFLSSFLEAEPRIGRPCRILRSQCVQITNTNVQIGCEDVTACPNVQGLTQARSHYRCFLAVQPSTSLSTRSDNNADGSSRRPAPPILSANAPSTCANFQGKTAHSTTARESHDDRPRTQDHMNTVKSAISPENRPTQICLDCMTNPRKER